MYVGMLGLLSRAIVQDCLVLILHRQLGNFTWFNIIAAMAPHPSIKMEMNEILANGSIELMGRWCWLLLSLMQFALYTSSLMTPTVR